jgi:hypothetical protein
MAERALLQYTGRTCPTCGRCLALATCPGCGHLFKDLHSCFGGQPVLECFTPEGEPTEHGITYVEFGDG